MNLQLDVLEAITDAIRAEPDAQAALQRTVELLQARFVAYNWVGIYLLEGDELVLGPYVGKPSPHTRIPLNRGTITLERRESRIMAAVAVDDTEVVVFQGGETLPWSIGPVAP